MSRKHPTSVDDTKEIKAMVTKRQIKLAMFFGRWFLGWFLRGDVKHAAGIDESYYALKYYLYRDKEGTLYLSHRQGHKERLLFLKELRLDAS